MTILCTLCHDIGSVCEEHPDKPMDRIVDGEKCAGPGKPCPWCNRIRPPKLPEGFEPATMVERGKYIGKLKGEPPKDEAEHFIQCPACGGWIDCRDLGCVFAHEGPLPHPSEDKPQ